MADSFEALAAAGLIERTLATRLKKAVGFRNIAIHNYESIDWNIVYAITTHRLIDFAEFAAAVSSRLDQRIG